MPLHITPLSPALGALVGGVDLREPLSAEHRDGIEAALLKHQVLFFRAQPLEPTQQARFAAQFGDLHIHPIYPNIPEQPEVLVLDTAVTDVRDNALWHTDVTFMETPALGAVLSAKLLPPVGGDTLWASSSAAFEALSAPLQRMLEGLTATHDLARSFPEERFSLTAEEREKLEAAKRKHPPVSHPRWCAPTRSPGARGCSSAKASPPASTSCRRRKATPCCASSSPTPPARSSPCAGAGRRTTWPSGTTASPSTSPSTTTAPPAA